MNLVYPRLANADARLLAEELRAASHSGLDRVREFVDASHPRAAAVPTGGRPATEPEIGRVREDVLEEVGRWVNGTILARRSQPEFDAVLGQSLHRALHIIPADAAHPETWNFLTLVVLPDVALTRFPTLIEERALGGPRNVLRRAWTRWEVLGDLLMEGEPLMGEDELVGLLERTAVARNRRLARTLAEAVIRYGGRRARSEYARDLYKRVRHQTGPLMLDLYTESDLNDLVRVESQACG